MSNKTSIFDELEIATVDHIIARRYDFFKKKPEYLVAW
jgi:hypothetical protein